MSKHLNKFKANANSRGGNYTHRAGDISHDESQLVEQRSMWTPAPQRKKKLAETIDKEHTESELLKFSDALTQNSHNGAFIGMKGNFS